MTLKDAMLKAKQEPESDYARKLFDFISNGAADEQAQIEGVDLSPFGRTMSSRDELKEQQDEAGEFRLQQSKGKTKELLKEHASTIGLIGGSIIGGIPGAGIGAGLGELTEQKLRGEETQPGKIAIEGIKGVATEIGARGVIKIGQLMIKAGPPIVKSILDAAKVPAQAVGRIGKTAIESIKRVVGISDNAAETIAKFPNEVEAELQAIKSAKGISRTPITIRTQKATQQFEKELGETYDSQWKKLLKSGEKYTYNNQEAVGSINRFLEAEKANGNIWFEISPSGKLSFTNSSLTKTQQQKAVKVIVDEINNAKPKNIAEIRSLKRRLNNIYKEFSSQFDKNPQLDRVVTNMINSVDDAMPPAFREINKEFSEGMKFLEKVQERLLPESSTGLLKSSALGKVGTAGEKEIQDLYPSFFKDFQTRTGLDLTHQLSIFNTAREISPFAIKPEGDISSIVKIIQKTLNPLIGRVRIEVAKGNFDLFINGLKETAKISKEAKLAVQPIIDLVKNETIPTSIKIGIFELLARENEEQ